MVLKEVETRRIAVGGGATRREAPVEVGVSSRETPFACSGVRSRVHQGGPIGGVRAGQTPVRSGPNTHASKCTQIEHRRGRSGRHELGSEPLEAVRSHKSDHVPGAGSHGIVRRQRYARASPEPGAPPSRDAPPIVAKMPPEQQTDPPHPPQPPLTVPPIDPQASRSWVSCRSATWCTRPSSCTCRYTSQGACARPRSASRSRA